MTLISELTELLIKSRDPEELRHVWIEWRRKTGEQVRGLYQQYVDLSNKAAQLNSTDIDANRNQLKANR
jgi:peptidyl-dipeptidase A